MVFGHQRQGLQRQAPDEAFQFPVGIRWCSDESVQFYADDSVYYFQFPVGIRWCSDEEGRRVVWVKYGPFNSLWELDGVRTTSGFFGQILSAPDVLSIPCGN